MNKLSAKDVADIFTNNDDNDGNNLTISEIQRGIMMNLESEQMYELHKYFK